MKITPKISVVVLTYNPIWEKLKATLKSIISQEEIEYEILVADDGSSYNCKEEVESFFDANSFYNFTFLAADENLGTCKNVNNAIHAAKGEFIKLISPGDFLYSSNTLKLWYEYVKRNNKELCFGESAYYSVKNEKISISKVLHLPQNISIYKTKKVKHKYIKENALLLSDFPIGAAFLVSKKLMQKYCDLIVGKVKYAEDFMYRIMVADSIPILYYPDVVVWYEYGEGISTSGNDKWTKLLDIDLSNAYDIMFEEIAGKDFFDRKFKFWLRKGTEGKLLKYILFPRLIIWRLVCKFHKSYTPQEVDKQLCEKYLR